MNDITVNNNLLDRITYKTDDDGNLTNEVANGGNFISWTPIGAANNGYQGTFDGNGKTISGLFFNDSQKVMLACLTIYIWQQFGMSVSLILIFRRTLCRRRVRIWCRWYDNWQL